MRTKRKKRKATTLAYSVGLLFISFALYMVSSLYLKQYNNQISFKLQAAQRQIQVLSTEKEALKVEIDNLASKSIVVDLASSDDMKVNKDSVIYISGKDE